jgi:hypothetical protein
MTYNLITLFNLALRRAKSLATLDVVSVAGAEKIRPLHEAQIVLDRFQTVLQRVCSEFPWAFETVRMEVVATTGPTEEMSGYKYAYQLPADCIRMGRVIQTTLHGYTDLPHRLVSHNGDMVILTTEQAHIVEYQRLHRLMPDSLAEAAL